MNILHLRASNFYGGPERQLHLHAREARDSKYNVTVASFSENGNMPEYLQTIAEDNIPTHLFEVSSAYDTSVIALIRDYLEKGNVSILCSHDYRTTVWACLAARRSKSRWLAFSRGYTQDNLKVRLYHTVDKFLIRQANHIVAVSGAQKDRLRRLLIRERQISVVSNAIAPKIFDETETVNLRSRFAFEPDAIVAVSGGRFSREKGQRYLIEAAAVAIKQNPKLRFVLFGDGPDLEHEREHLRSLRLEGKVICPGFERNLVGCLKDADILVNPSLSEGLPNIVLEAMAVRTAAVATAVGGVPEIIDDGKTGLLVPARDADALAKAILRAADNSEMRAGLTEQALSLIKAEYSFERQFEKLAQLYDRFGN